MDSRSVLVMEFPCTSKLIGSIVSVTYRHRALLWRFWIRNWYSFCCSSYWSAPYCWSDALQKSPRMRRYSAFAVTACLLWHFNRSCYLLAYICILSCLLAFAQNPLHMFSRNFPIDGEVANLLPTNRCNGIWKTTRHNRHNCCPRQLVTDLLRTCRLFCGLVTGKLV